MRYNKMARVRRRRRSGVDLRYECWNKEIWRVFERKMKCFFVWRKTGKEVNLVKSN